MASTCISTVLKDTRVPVRATYANLYKWPESDAAFVRSVSSSGRHRDHPAVVDSISCRQLYLRSYTFSRKESVPEKTKRCLGRVRDRVVVRRRKRQSSASCGGGGGGRKMCRRAKRVSCAALMKMFRRLLACTTKVDVVG